jgi:hypothetical protein
MLDHSLAEKEHPYAASSRWVRGDDGPAPPGWLYEPLV